jgi:biopolymer transport protein ExbD
MRQHRMPAIREGGVNVTPLIDIVMCLIIFFMLVAKIGVDTGADRNIDIPTSIL